MGRVSIDLLIILLLILCNGVLAMAELAIVSARRVRLETRAAAGHPGARAALNLAAEPTRFLSTVQIGITLIGILAGAFGGANLSREVADWLRDVPVLDRYASGLGIATVVLGITLLSLIFGELVPKRLALHNPEGLAQRLARPMTVLSVIVGPVALALSRAVDAILRLFRLSADGAAQVTEEEIQLLLEEGAAAGVFEEAEQDLVERIFQLGDQRASELMTPRHRLVYLDLEEPEEENRRRIVEARFSHFPLCEGDLDHVVGIVPEHAYWRARERGQDVSLRELAVAPLFVPESMPALRVADLFKQVGQHRALVVDEYGIVQGLVTFTDIFEAIIGDLAEAGSAHGRDAVRRDDNSWLIDGAMPLDALKELLEIDALPDEERGVYSTLAGFMLLQFGRIPRAADAFEWDGMRFEVVDMDGNRIDKVLVSTITGRPISAESGA